MDQSTEGTAIKKAPSKSVSAISDQYEKYNFDEDDVRILMEQSGVEFDVALNTLIETKGDLVGSIGKCSRVILPDGNQIALGFNKCVDWHFDVKATPFLSM